MDSNGHAGEVEWPDRPSARSTCFTKRMRFGAKGALGHFDCDALEVVFVEPESSPAMEVLFLSSEMLGYARSTLFVLLLSTK